MIKVKVCGMRDAKNIEEISAGGPDMLGFIFHPGSARYVGEQPDPSLFRIAGKGILTTGVFVDVQPETILEVVRRYSLNQIQLHGRESIHECGMLRAAGYSVIKAFALSRDFDFGELASFVPVCDYFLFDTPTTKHGGSGLKFQWELLEKYRLEKPFFLSGGIGPQDARMILDLHHPALYAVDINSKFELSPGIKDIRKVKQFILQIKSAT